jgi:molybdenum cofactor cytidylyltransferase
MEREQAVAAVVLAAGESRRFGRAKQLAELDGRTLLEHVLALAEAAGLAPIVAVVPVWLTRPRAMDDQRLRWVRNSHPGRGLSHSLRLGFEALDDATAAAVILLGDQPTVPPATIPAILASRGERPIVATMVEGRLAPPVLIERSHFDVVWQPSGDIGLREILNAHPEWVAAVQLEEAIADVDTADDLRALRGKGRVVPG